MAKPSDTDTKQLCKSCKKKKHLSDFTPRDPKAEAGKFNTNCHDCLDKKSAAAKRRAEEKKKNEDPTTTQTLVPSFTTRAQKAAVEAQEVKKVKAMDDKAAKSFLDMLEPDWVRKDNKHTL